MVFPVALEGFPAPLNLAVSIYSEWPFSLPRPALPPWPLPLGTHRVGGGTLSSVRLGQTGLWSEKVGSVCRRPECPSRLLEPCSSLQPTGLATPEGSLFLAVSAQE